MTHTNNQHTKCDTFMDTYLQLDKNAFLPLSLTLHLLTCKKCRTQVRLLTKAEKVLAEPIKVQVPSSDATIEAVLKQINPTYNTQELQSPISLSKWIVSGLIMIVLLIVFGLFTNNMGNSSLLIPFYLTFATIVVTYCAMFIGCNMDFFVKKIETLHIAI
ncbi:MAG: hypothetical protein K6E51_10130 [Treponema sp.]|nr:hypothetical protein [Treponema sp.]